MATCFRTLALLLSLTALFPADGGAQTESQTAGDWWKAYQQATGEARTPAKAEDRRFGQTPPLWARAAANLSASKAGTRWPTGL